MNYRLIVIENSLKEKSVLKKYKILSKTFFEKDTPLESVMDKIKIPENEINIVKKSLKNSLIHPYYCHLYHEDQNNDSLIVVFHKKIFYTHKSNFTDASMYGISHDISKEQMDIKPRNVLDEEW